MDQKYHRFLKASQIAKRVAQRILEKSNVLIDFYRLQIVSGVLSYSLFFRNKVGRNL